MGSVNHELQFLRSNQFSGDLENSEVQALRKERQISRKILVFACTVAVTGFVCLVIGIALLRMNRLDEHISTKPDNNCASNGGETSVITKTTNFTQSCSYSEEFKKSGTLQVTLVLCYCIKSYSNVGAKQFTTHPPKFAFIESENHWLVVLQFKLTDRFLI